MKPGLHPRKQKMVGGTLVLAYSVQFQDEGLNVGYVDRLLPADDAVVVPKYVSLWPSPVNRPI